MWKPESIKHSSSSPLSRNVNFEPKFLEEIRLYLFCLSLWCPHFSLYRNFKKDITEFSNVCYSIYKYFGDNHYTFFKTRRSLGGVLPLILMDISAVVTAPAREAVHLFKLFQLSYFSALQPFQLLKNSAFSANSWLFILMGCCCFFLFFFLILLIVQLEECDRNRVREGEWHAAKGPEPDLRNLIRSVSQFWTRVDPLPVLLSSVKRVIQTNNFSFSFNTEFTTRTQWARICQRHSFTTLYSLF